LPEKLTETLPTLDNEQFFNEMQEILQDWPLYRIYFDIRAAVSLSCQVKSLSSVTIPSAVNSSNGVPKVCMAIRHKRAVSVRKTTSARIAQRMSLVIISTGEEMKQSRVFLKLGSIHRLKSNHHRGLRRS
jgi:hypothetical protein